MAMAAANIGCPVAEVPAERSAADEKMAAAEQACIVRNGTPTDEEKESLSALKKGSNGRAMVPYLQPFQMAHFYSPDRALALLRQSMRGSSEEEVNTQAATLLNQWFFYKGNKGSNANRKGEFNFKMKYYAEAFIELKANQEQGNPKQIDALKKAALQRAEDSFRGIETHLSLSTAFEASKEALLDELNRFCTACAAADAGDDDTEESKEAARENLYVKGFTYFVSELGKQSNVEVWTPNYEHQHRHRNMHKVHRAGATSKVLFSVAASKRLETGVSKAANEWLSHNAEDIVNFCLRKGDDGPACNRMCRHMNNDSKAIVDDDMQIWGFCPDSDAKAYLEKWEAAKNGLTEAPARPTERKWATMDRHFDWSTPGFSDLVNAWEKYINAKRELSDHRQKGYEKYESELQTFLTNGQQRNYAHDAKRKSDQKEASNQGSSSSDPPPARKASRVGVAISQRTAQTTQSSSPRPGGKSPALSSPLSAVVAAPSAPRSVAAVQQELADKEDMINFMHNAHVLLEKQCLALPVYTGIHGYKVELYRAIILSSATVVVCDEFKYPPPSLLAPAWRHENDRVSFATTDFQTALFPWIEAGEDRSRLGRKKMPERRLEISTEFSKSTSLLPYAATWDASEMMLCVNYDALMRYHKSVFDDAHSILSEFCHHLEGEHHTVNPAIRDRFMQVCEALERARDNRPPQENDSFHMNDPLFTGDGLLLCDRPKTSTKPSLGAALVEGRIRPYRFIDHVHNKKGVSEISMLPLKFRPRARLVQLVWETRINPAGEPPEWIIYIDGVFLERANQNGQQKYLEMVVKPDRIAEHLLHVRRAGYESGDSEDEEPTTSSLDYFEGNTRELDGVAPLLCFCPMRD